MNKGLTITIDTAKNERKYLFTLPYGAPYAEVYEVLQEMTEDLKKYEQECLAAAEEQKQKEQAQPIEVSAQETV
jgi:hypothetical protein